jgi:hypothetical protein
MAELIVPVIGAQRIKIRHFGAIVPASTFELIGQSGALQPGFLKVGKHRIGHMAMARAQSIAHLYCPVL